MKICGIICEYNPFHNGHLYQLQETRRLGATHIVAIMSGNYVQRGDIALLDKFTRARLAVECGADMVIELPTPSALSSAEYFARGGIYLLNTLGCIDQVSFGSECGDLSTLRQAAKSADGLVNSPALKALLKAGASFPSALQKLVSEENGSAAGEVFSHPNNLLAIEYLRALEHFSSPIEPLTIPRKSVAHDSGTAAEHMASASYIRKAVRSGGCVEDYLPPPVFSRLQEACENGGTADFSRLEQAILYRFRSLSAAEIVRLPDVSHGLENRILQAAREAESLGELLSLIKTKRYTMARIRRILLAGLIGMEKRHMLLPPYARILAMNARGCEILERAKKTARLPLDTSLLRLKNTSPEAKIFAELEASATDIYALAFQKIRSCGLEYTAKIQKQA